MPNVFSNVFFFILSYDAALLNLSKFLFFMHLWEVFILPVVSVFTYLPLHINIFIFLNRLKLLLVSLLACNLIILVKKNIYLYIFIV